MIHELGSIGSIKFCKVHDLVRDLCLREAQKEGFYTVFPGHEITNRVDRIVVSSTTLGINETGPLLSSLPLAHFSILDLDRIFQQYILRLVRIVGSYNIEYVDHLVNSRFFTSSFTGEDTEKFPSTIWLFWNLHTLIANQFDFKFTTPSDFWYMSHLRHVYFNNLRLQHDLHDVPDGVVLTNLQTLGKIYDFKCSEQVVKRIPNIRKLRVTYNEDGDDRFHLTNLARLDKLESLSCSFFKRPMCRVDYPLSLKKLLLSVRRSRCWEDILDKIGSLPLLQKLTLYSGTFKEGQWETSEGQFRSLKFLSLEECEGLKVWTSEASHFLSLEQLHLSFMKGLEEVPSDFAESLTLRLIDLYCCNDSAVESAKRIQEEQEGLYGEITLKIEVNALEE